MGAVDFNSRLRVAGPTIVVTAVNAGVWNAMPFAAGTGVQSQGGGTVGVDVQPGQTVYLQVGGISTQIGAPSVPGFATGTGRAEGSFGQGGISRIPQANAEYLMKQSTEQQPLPASAS